MGSVTKTPVSDLDRKAELDKMACTSGICAYCRRDTMVYALAEFTCRKCVLEADRKSRKGQG